MNHYAVRTINNGIENYRGAKSGNKIQENESKSQIFRETRNGYTDFLSTM